MHNVSTTQLLISLYGERVMDPSPGDTENHRTVCAEFLGPEIGTGWGYRGKCALQQPGQGYLYDRYDR